MKNALKLMNGYTHSFSDDLKICTVVGIGIVNMESTIRAMNDLVNDPSFHKNMPIIVDLRRINFHPSYDELIGMKEHLQFLENNFHNKIALFTDDTLWSVAHLVCVLLKKTSKIKMRTFRNIEKAHLWLQKQNNHSNSLSPATSISE